MFQSKRQRRIAREVPLRLTAYAMVVITLTASFYADLFRYQFNTSQAEGKELNIKLQAIKDARLKKILDKE